MDTPKPGMPNDWRRDLLLLTVLLGLLFGFALGSRSLWSPDEGRYAEIPREMVASGDYVTPRLNGVKYFEKPPLVYWIESATIHLLGLNEWALRLPIALAALLGCLGVYAAGRRLFNRRTGLLAAALLATSPLYYILARTITLDMVLSVLVSLALLAFLVGVREPAGPQRRWLLWIFYALAALAVLAKGLIGLVIPGMIIGCWILVLNDWRILTKIYLPSGLLIFLLIAAPWHIMAARANPDFAYFYFVHEHFQRYLTRVHSRYQPPWFFIAVLIVGLFPWTAFLLQSLRAAWPSSWATRGEQRELLFLLLWAGLVFVFFSASDSKLATYILPIFPPLALLIAQWLDRRWDQQGAPGLRGGLIALLITAVILSAALAIIPPRLSEHQTAVQVASQLGIGLYVFCALLLCVGLLPWILGRRHYAKAITTLLIANALLWSFVATELPTFDDDNSIKSLALELRSRLRPGDEIISYRDYYQDLPFYLRQRVSVAAYQGELAFGINAETSTRQWMIGEIEFERRWHNDAQVYVITSHQNYKALMVLTHSKPRLIAEAGDNVLISNR